MVLLLMANYASCRSNIHLSQLFKIPEPLLKETARVLAANGVACIAQDDGVLWIGPEDGLEAYIAFHKPDRIVF